MPGEGVWGPGKEGELLASTCSGLTVVPLQADFEVLLAVLQREPTCSGRRKALTCGKRWIGSPREMWRMKVSGKYQLSLVLVV